MPARTLTVMPNVNGKHAAPTRVRVVLYARVSSKEQREEGYSIDAQVRLLTDVKFAMSQRDTTSDENGGQAE
jgi:predicted site-specific integrase-resolvase